MREQERTERILSEMQTVQDTKLIKKKSKEKEKPMEFTVSQFVKIDDKYRHLTLRIKTDFQSANVFSGSTLYSFKIDGKEYFTGEDNKVRFISIYRKFLSEEECDKIYKPNEW